MDPVWRSALLDPRTYPHPVREIQLCETHISIVALTGEYAYKLKKAVDHGFLDFTSLEKRRRFCSEEVRLNRRTAPLLYLGVVPLARVAGGFRFEGEGPVEEYAVRMRQFPPEDRLDRVAARGGLTDEILVHLADEVARLHATSAEGHPELAASYPGRLRRIFLDNSALLPDSPRERALSQSFTSTLSGRRKLLDSRAAAGRVREVHGDLHMANVCLWSGEPVIFDCIEFSEDLRIIDVLSDAAFLYMDLVESGFESGAQLLLSQYLEATGDYDGLEAWPLFVAYRAHVRAMVSHLTLASARAPPPGGGALEARGERYLALAESALAKPRAGIVILTGLPGSGKSTEAIRIARAEGGVRIRSDVERKRIHAVDPSLELYSSEMTARTYTVLLAHARAASLGGLLAVLDATFLRREERARAIRLARELGVPVRIVHMRAPLDVLEARIASRRRGGGDASDADARVLRELFLRWESFSAEEEPLVRRPHEHGE